MKCAHHLAFVSACMLLAPSLAFGQVVEIPAMTVSHTAIDMDSVGPAGTTTLAAVNAAGTPAAASITAITLTPSTATLGVYNTNPGQGRALAIDATGALLLVDPPAGNFTAFNASIDLGCVATEFGCSIGDWNGPMILDCYANGTQVGTVTISYSGGGSRYLQSSVPFDRVDIMATSTGGNWVIPDLFVECSGPQVMLSQPSPGMLQVDNIGLIVGEDTWNGFTINDPCPGPAGSGPFFGLCASSPATVSFMIEQVTSLASPSNPFHFVAPGAAISWGPFAILPGITLEAVCFRIDSPTGTFVVGRVDRLVTL